MKFSPIRYFKEVRLRRLFEPVRERLQTELSLFLQKPCRLVPARGKGGYDRLYYVEADNERLAIMRVKNSLGDSEICNKEGDIRMALTADVRLDYEWQAYSTLSQKSLSPMPLWRSPEAIVSAYHPFKRASEILKADEQQVWTLLPWLFSLVRGMHEAKVVHMDLNLGNILIDPLSARALVIDFEYAPARSLTFEQACLCDYCRLIGDLFRPRRGGTALRRAPERFLEVLRAEVSLQVGTADWTVVRNAFPKLFQDKQVASALETLCCRT